MGGLAPVLGALGVGAAFGLGGQALRERAASRRGAAVQDLIGTAGRTDQFGRQRPGTGFLGAGGFENPEAVTRFAADLAGIEGMTQVSGQLFAQGHRNANAVAMQTTRLAQEERFNNASLALQRQGLSATESHREATRMMRARELQQQADFNAQRMELQKRGLAIRAQNSQWISTPQGPIPTPMNKVWQDAKTNVGTREQALRNIIEMENLFNTHGRGMVLGGEAAGEYMRRRNQAMSYFASVLNHGGTLTPGEQEMQETVLIDPTSSVFYREDTALGQLKAMRQRLVEALRRSYAEQSKWGLAFNTDLWAGDVLGNLEDQGFERVDEASKPSNTVTMDEQVTADIEAGRPRPEQPPEPGEQQAPARNPAEFARDIIDRIGSQQPPESVRDIPTRGAQLGVRG